MANGLNVATSIVDFLKARGLKPQAGERFPFFETRGQLFNRLGLGTDLGQFRGTAAQNTALLRNLQQAEKSTGISITSENLFDVAMVAQGGGTAQPVPLQQTPQEIPGITTGLPGEAGGGITAGRQGLTTGLPREAGGGITRGAPSATFPITATPPPPTAITQPQQAFPAGDVSGLLPQIPSAQDVQALALEQVQRGATFPLQQEAVGAEKEAIRLSAQRQKESFIQQIASRGLFFSGQKTKGVQTIEADQLAQILGVDRKFALLIAQGLERSAQDIVKEAQKGRQEAIASLGALGFAINPVTGRVEPTLQAKQAVAQERRLTVQQQQQAQQFAISQAGVQARFEATEARLRAQQEVSAAQTAFNQAVTLDQRRIAQSNLEIAQRRLQLAEEAVEPPPTPTPDQITRPEDLSPLAKAIFDRTGKLSDLTPTQRANILPELNAVGFSSVLKAEDAQSLKFVDEQMKNVLNNWKKVPSKCLGNIQGRAPFGVFDPFKCGQDPDVIRFNTSVGVVGQTLANMLENGRLTDSDRLFYAGLIPTRLIENPEAAKAASDEMQRLLKAKLNTDVREMEEDIIDATQTDIDYINSLNLP